MGLTHANCPIIHKTSLWNERFKKILGPVLYFFWQYYGFVTATRSLSPVKSMLELSHDLKQVWFVRSLLLITRLVLFQIHLWNTRHIRLAGFLLYCSDRWFSWLIGMFRISHKFRGLISVSYCSYRRRQVFYNKSSFLVIIQHLSDRVCDFTQNHRLHKKSTDSTCFCSIFIYMFTIPGAKNYRYTRL